MIENETLVKLVGRENLDISQSSLDRYSSDMSFVEPVRPACVVRVRNVEEVPRTMSEDKTLTKGRGWKRRGAEYRLSPVWYFLG